MVVHIVKLCVGVDRVEELVEWQKSRWADYAADPSLPPPGHVTRMKPRREDEILDGGSLYWVIKGNILVRQQITGIEPVTGDDGIQRCRLVLLSPLILTRPQPRRPFQGWRYLKTEDAPPDLAAQSTAEASMPEEMRIELGELGLI
jgi:hypothetical protein